MLQLNFPARQYCKHLEVLGLLYTCSHPPMCCAEEISQQLDAQLHISEEARVLPEQAHTHEEILTPLQQLLKLCDQQVLQFSVLSQAPLAMTFIPPAASACTVAYPPYPKPAYTVVD